MKCVVYELYLNKAVTKKPKILRIKSTADKMPCDLACAECPSGTHSPVHKGNIFLLPDLLRVSTCSVYAFPVRWKHWERMSMSVSVPRLSLLPITRPDMLAFPLFCEHTRPAPASGTWYLQLPLPGMFGVLGASWLAPHMTSLEISSYSKLPATLVAPSLFCFFTALATK